jgi:hypothetical protein
LGASRRRVSRRAGEVASLVGPVPSFDLSPCTAAVPSRLGEGTVRKSAIAFMFLLTTSRDTLAARGQTGSGLVLVARERSSLAS